MTRSDSIPNLTARLGLRWKWRRMSFTARIRTSAQAHLNAHYVQRSVTHCYLSTNSCTSNEQNDHTYLLLIFKFSQIVPISCSTSRRKKRKTGPHEKKRKINCLLSLYRRKQLRSGTGANSCEKNMGCLDKDKGFSCHFADAHTLEALRIVLAVFRIHGGCERDARRVGASGKTSKVARMYDASFIFYTSPYELKCWYSALFGSCM